VNFELRTSLACFPHTYQPRTAANSAVLYTCSLIGRFRVFTNRLRLARNFRIRIHYQVRFLLVFRVITLQYAQCVQATWATNYCFVLKQCVFANCWVRLARKFCVYCYVRLARKFGLCIYYYSGVPRGGGGLTKYQKLRKFYYTK
jgi:hypothetical protein